MSIFIEFWLGEAPVKFPRRRWTKARSSLLTAGLLWNIHCVYPHVYTGLCIAKREGDPGADCDTLLMIAYDPTHRADDVEGPAHTVDRTDVVNDSHAR